MVTAMPMAMGNSPRLRLTAIDMDMKAILAAPYVRAACFCILALPLSVAAAANAIGNLDLVSPPSWISGVPGSKPAGAAQIVDRDIANGKGLDRPRRLEPIALASLRNNPLNTREIRTLGLVAEANGRETRALSLMRVANQVSRRDPVTELWLIDQSVRSNNLGGALAHYDSAMSSSTAIWTQLFPILDDALTEPQIQSFVAQSMREKRAWSRPFVDFAIGTGKHLPEVAGTIMQTKRTTAIPDWEQLDRSVVQRLSEQRSFAVLSRYLRSMPGSPSKILGAVNFRDDTIAPKYNPVSWTLSPQSEVATQFTGNGALSVSIAPNSTQVVARKLMLLNPGRYRLTGQLRVLERSDQASIEILQSCGTQSAKASRWTIYSGAPGSSQRFGLVIDVGNACPAWDLAIQAHGGESQTGLTFEIGDLAIAPAS